MSAGAAAAAGPDPLGLVPLRRLLVVDPLLTLAIEPGDRAVVTTGTVVAAGDLLVERVRDPHLVSSATVAGDGVAPGGWVAAGESRRGGATPAGEVLLVARGRRRLVIGSHPDRLEAPVRGRVGRVRPGADLELAVEGVGLAGTALLGDPVHGRLVVLPAEGDTRPALDVSLGGTIVAFPGRVDAETLIRARAMGIHGAVVVSLAERERRALVESEARQRAGLHRLAPYGVLLLDGTVRRPLAGPFAAILAVLAGREVGLAGEPPLLVAGRSIEGFPIPPADHVRLRGGPDAGAEGRWLGPVGPRRFAPGIVVEAGLVETDDGRVLVVPLGDIERFG
ncbi:MAG: hypothetical protein MUC54_02285 [Chloroflexi bacterium]|nr:hypothetical protein [Chloroflexota bacterium]